MTKKSAENFLKNLAVQTDHANPKPKSAALGVDFGEKFCGLAWTPDGIVVFPLEVVPTADILATLTKKSAEKSINLVVLGLPVDGDNLENHVCAQIRKFGDQLVAAGLIVEYVNERFSTQNTLISDTEARCDDLAAAQILEFWLQKCS